MKVYKAIITALILMALSMHDGLCQGSFGGGMKVKTGVAKSDDGKHQKDNDRVKLQKFTGKSNINPQIKPKLYRSIRRVYGRFVGVGKEIQDSEKQHYQYLFKLSEQNMAGSWTKIEAVSFDGQLTTKHSLGTYILNQHDEGDSEANKEWKEKLKRVCQWSIMYDATGMTVVQERAYDEKGNLIYTYSPMKISDNEVVGTYSNCWGIPVNLRGKYGATLIKIKWDEKGNEVEHVFIDEKGRLVKNQNGAYISKYEYDTAGNQILNYSCDEFGDPMIDNSGTCGCKAEYDKSHNQTKICYLDEEMQMMTMPSNEKNAGNDYQGVATVSRRFDKWNRTTSETFNDENGKPITNTFGYHRVVMEYNNNGNQTWTRYYGMDGKICGNSFLYGAGSIHREYDEWGNLRMIEFYGRDTTERVNGGKNRGWCKWESHNINRDESYDFYKEYVMHGGRMVCSYSYEKKGDIAIQVFADSTIRVDSFDTSGHLVSETHIDYNGKPYEPYGYHKMVSSWQKIGKNVTFVKTQWYGADGELTNYKDVAITETETDSLNRTVRTRMTNANGIMVHHHKTYRDEDWNIVKQEELNVFGNKARTMRYGSYYMIETKLSFDNGISDLYSRNEFGEPAYDNCISKIYCHQREMEDSTIYYDENGSVIRNFSQFKKELPTAFVVEVTDSAGYKTGLRDGDVIVQYGDWKYDVTKPGNVKIMYRGDINASFVAEASHEKTMRVLRHDVTNNKSEIVTLNLGKGRIDELGFNSHYIYYTKNEYARLQNALNKFVDTNGLRQEWQNTTKKASKYACVIPEYSNYINAQLCYNYGLTAPMIILAIDRHLVGENLNEPPSPGNQWISGEDTEMMDIIIWNKDSAKVAKHVLYGTRDGVTIDTISFEFKDMRYQRSQTIANEDLYIVQYNEQFSEHVKQLMRKLKAGACGFRKSDAYKSLEYITLDEMLQSDTYAHIKTLTMKDDGQGTFEVILSNSELKKSSVDSIIALTFNAKSMKMAHRLKSVMEGHEVACEVVDGSIVYEYSIGKELRRVLMLNLDKNKLSLMMYCNMNKSEFNPKKFVHSLDNFIEATESENIQIIKIVPDGTVNDKEKHLNGEYVILEFEGWNMYESKNEFLSNTRMAAGKTKTCVIAPIKRDKAGKIGRIGKPEARNIDNFTGWNCEIDETIDWKRVAEIYEIWKGEH